MTELSRFCALCDEHGVTYGQGVAMGLNLQHGGRHTIWFGYPNWALELYQQANARLYRQGQERPVISHMLVVQGGMDTEVVRALQNKGDAQADLMDALKAKIRRARR